MGKRKSVGKIVDSRITYHKAGPTKFSTQYQETKYEEVTSYETVTLTKTGLEYFY